MNSRAFPLPLNSDNIPHNSIQYSYTNRKHFSANDFQKIFFYPLRLFFDILLITPIFLFTKKIVPRFKTASFSGDSASKKGFEKIKTLFSFYSFFLQSEKREIFFYKN